MRRERALRSPLGTERYFFGSSTRLSKRPAFTKWYLIGSEPRSLTDRTLAALAQQRDELSAAHDEQPV